MLSRLFVFLYVPALPDISTKRRKKQKPSLSIIMPLKKHTHTHTHTHMYTQSAFILYYIIRFVVQFPQLIPIINSNYFEKVSFCNLHTPFLI